MLTKKDKKNILITTGGIYVIMYILQILNLVTSLIGMTITVIFQYFLNRTQLMGYHQFCSRENRFAHNFPMRIGKNVEQAIIIFNCMASNLALIGFALVTVIASSIAGSILSIDVDSMIYGIAISCIILSIWEFMSIYGKIQCIDERFTDTSFKFAYWALDSAVFGLILLKGMIVYVAGILGYLYVLAMIFMLVFFLLLIYVTKLLEVGLHIKKYSIILNMNWEAWNSDIFSVQTEGVCKEYVCSRYYPIITEDGKCKVLAHDRLCQATGKFISVKRMNTMNTIRNQTKEI